MDDGRPSPFASATWSRRYSTTVAAYDALADEPRLVPRNRAKAIAARHANLPGQLPPRLVAPSKRPDRA